MSIVTQSTRLVFYNVSQMLIYLLPSSRLRIVVAESRFRFSLNICFCPAASKVCFMSHLLQKIAFYIMTKVQRYFQALGLWGKRNTNQYVNLSICQICYQFSPGFCISILKYSSLCFFQVFQFPCTFLKTCWQVNWLL